MFNQGRHMRQITRPGHTHGHSHGHTHGQRNVAAGRPGAAPAAGPADSPMVVFRAGKRLPQEQNLISFFAKRGVNVDPKACDPATNRGNKPTLGGLEQKLADAMFIFIGNIGGSSVFLANELRSRGITAEVFGVSRPHSENAPDLIPLKYANYTNNVARNDLDKIMVVQGNDARIGWGIPILKKVMIYNGNDLRLGLAPRLTPAFVSSKAILKLHPQAVLLNRMANFQRFGAINVLKEAKEKYKTQHGVDLIIGHFPSFREAKNSEVADQAAKILAEKGKKIEYWTTDMRTIPYLAMVYAFNFCDYVLDEFNTKERSFGMTSIQALMCGATPISNWLLENLDDERLSKMILPAEQPQDIVKLIEEGAKVDISRQVLSELYHPKNVADAFLKQLDEWKMLGVEEKETKPETPAPAPDEGHHH